MDKTEAQEKVVEIFISMEQQKYMLTVEQEALEEVKIHLIIVVPEEADILRLELAVVVPAVVVTEPVVNTKSSSTVVTVSRIAWAEMQNLVGLTRQEAEAILPGCGSVLCRGAGIRSEG